MATERLDAVLHAQLQELRATGADKGSERVVSAVIDAEQGKGPRVLLEGEGDRQFMRMNSNSYLGLGLDSRLKAASEDAVMRFGTGPGAVRFISGTHTPHVELERALASFHGREAGMLMSSAYATMVSVIVPLTTRETAIVSDELNHNCIINAIRLSRPLAKFIYRHLDLQDLRGKLTGAVESGAKRCLVVTDGIFSMRGVHAPLVEINAVLDEFRDAFEEDLILITDDSHGVAAVGETGRGTEELTGAPASDILVGTLGKGFGVNGGYVVGSDTLISYLRETSMMYIYSNPITPGEAAAGLESVRLVDSSEGVELLARVRSNSERFRKGLEAAGLETLPGEHPVVPLMVRDTARTNALVDSLFQDGVMATGLAFPVVPKGDESIRFQLAADHTQADVDFVLELLRGA